MSDSGPPRFWPFVQFDPVSFRVPERDVSKVFLHCSAWDNETFVGTQLTEEINRWHQQNGWQGVGYHFVIDKLGIISTGRPLDIVPAAQLGPDNKGNIGTIAICTQGLWHFTEKSLESTAKLCEAIDHAYAMEGKQLTFHGHCEIDNKPCPVYNYKLLLGLDASGNLGAVAKASAYDVALSATRSSGPQRQRDEGD